MQNETPAEIALGQNRHPRIVATSVLALAAIAAAIWLLASPTGTTGNFGGTDDRVDALEARIAAMELAQKQSQAQILAQLARISADRGNSPAAPSAEQLAAREKNRIDRQRMRDDPAFLLQHQTERLNEMQASLQSEPVNPAWSEQTSHDINEAIASSMAQAGNDVDTSSVDCRSTQCRISLEIPAGSTYEEMLMYMNTELADALPRSRVVVMPFEDGTQLVHIFAHAGSGPPPPPRD